MREIEFRGKVLESDRYWHVKKGDWIYGNCSYDKLNNEANIEDTSKEEISSIEVDLETVGQYTGRKDKKSKKIYEGDIVKINNKYIRYIVYSGVKSGFITMMYIDELESATMAALGEYEDYELEVIGNIHDNEEFKGAVQ